VASSIPAQTSSGFLADWRLRHQARLNETRHSVRIFFKDKLAVVGLAFIIFVVMVAIFAPVVAPHPDQGRGQSNLKERLHPPSAQYPFGNDNLGRDVLSRVIYGLRISLTVAAAVAIGVILIGVPLGGIAGYFGGWLDEVIMRVTDLILAFPSLILAMALVAISGPGLRNVAIALVITWWPWYARLVRGIAVSLRQRPYVKAARTMGVRSHKIIWSHILPNAVGPVIVQLTLDIGTVILAVAGLSFIGLGAQPPTPDLGLMISEGRLYILSQWWMAVFAGLAIFMLVLAFNFVGDGLRDVLDPRTRR
jgi:peptide/nickel transport system permease protein